MYLWIDRLSSATEAVIHVKSLTERSEKTEPEQINKVYFFSPYNLE